MRVLRMLVVTFGIVLLAGCGGEERIAVVPAKGKLWLDRRDGKLVPIGGARVVFNPVEGEDAFPVFPAATTGADGSFALGSYGETDGAPEGKYIVTIRWNKKKKPKYDLFHKGEVSDGPDQLGGLYSNRKTSRLRATVAAGKALEIVVPDR